MKTKTREITDAEWQRRWQCEMDLRQHVIYRHLLAQMRDHVYVETRRDPPSARVQELLDAAEAILDAAAR